MKLQTQNFLFVSVLLVLAMLPASQSLAATKPNFILVVADDLGYADVGFHGSTQIKTPHLDRLAAEGMVCTNGYVSAPVCSPSRAGLLPGRNQPTFGYDNNLAGTSRDSIRNSAVCL